MASTKGMFGERVVLEHTPSIRHKSSYLPDGNLSFEIIGCSGCGKSHMLLEIIPQIAQLTQVVCCTLIPDNPVFAALGKWCSSKDIEFSVYTDPETAKDELQTKITEKPEDEWGIVVFDDFSQQKSGRNDPYTQCASMVSAMLRNYHYHCAFITQSSTNVPTLYRNNANVRIVFQMNDQHAVRSIRGDLVCSGIVDSHETFDQLYELVRKQEHAYLMIVSKGKERKLYIWLPDFGAEEPPQLVEFKGQGLDVTADSHLHDLIEAYQAAASHKPDAMARMKLREAKRRLDRYIAVLANEHDLSTDAIRDAIAEECGLNV